MPARSSGAGFGSPARSSVAPSTGFSTSTDRNNLSYLAEPPDFSGITDANVVVSFKNLLKKDGTTKAKALEDLVVFAQAHPHEKDGGVEDGVLEAWVRAPGRPGMCTELYSNAYLCLPGPTVSPHVD